LARRCIPCIAELSGQDVFCLCPDGSLPDALRALRWARRLNHGHTCMAPVEFWVPQTQASQIGPLDIPVVAYDDVSQVQEWLMRRPGLGLSVFGQNDARRLANYAKTGFVTINDCIAPTADPRAAFGGTGAAGFGTTRGPEGLLAMTVPQNQFVNRGPRMHLRPPSHASHAIMHCYTDLIHGGAAARFWALAKLVPALLGWVMGSFRNSGEVLQGESPMTLTGVPTGHHEQKDFREKQV